MLNLTRISSLVFYFKLVSRSLKQDLRTFSMIVLKWIKEYNVFMKELINNKLSSGCTAITLQIVSPLQKRQTFYMVEIP